MNPALFLIVIAGIIVLPIALAAGGHNGASLAGVIIVILAIVLTIATAPSKESK